MGSWNEYKETYRTESNIYDYARAGDLRGLAHLLSVDHGLDLDAKNERGYSALMLAVYNGEQDFCEALIRGGADVNSCDAMQNTVLMAAAYKGNLYILTMLLECGANTKYKNKSQMDARDWALMFGRAEIVQYLDEHYPSLVSTSKFKSILKFIKLAFMMLKKRSEP